MRAVWYTLLLLLGVSAVAWSFVEPGAQDALVREAPLFAPAAQQDPSIWPVEKVRIVKMAWARERDIALITIWLENKNDLHVRDVMFECDFLAPDGFRFHRKREKPLASFPARKTARVARINFGFINRQVHMVDCVAIDAILEPPVELKSSSLGAGDDDERLIGLTKTANSVALVPLASQDAS